MGKTKDIQKPEKKTLLLETSLEHLENELYLTKKEADKATRNYFEIYSHMEGKVKERTAELEKANEQLKQKIKEHKRAEETLQGYTHDLDERAKELNCLYSISALVEKPGISLEEILQGRVDLMPPSWRCPEVTCARIILEGQVYTTAIFKETAWKQASCISVYGEHVGAVEIFYMEERPECDEGPFLKEERNLIDAVAERMGGIVERIQAEKARQESGKRYRRILTTVTDYIFTVRVENGCAVETIHSPACVAVTGYTPEDFTGDPYLWLNMVHAEDRNAVKEHALSVIAGNSAEPLEHRIVRKDGMIRWVKNTPVPQYDSGGKLVSYDGLIQDITERKKAEGELIRLSTALEQAHDSIKILGPDGTILYINTATEKVMGYKREEILGQNPFRIKYKKDADDLYNELKETISQGKVWSGHQTNIKKDGSSIELETTISPICDKSGNITNYVSISHDVTKELNMEKHLRQSQKMEAIGTLAGGIAHEFNNILGTVLGYTELSLDDTAEGTLTHRNMKEILKAGHRAKGLVEQILKFSRQEKNVLIPQKLTPIVKDAVKFLRSSLPSTIEVHQNIQPENDKVLSDVTQIHQIVLNLCSNAAYAMREKEGVLGVRLDNVNLELGNMDRYPDLNPGTYLRLTVSDTGHGMDRAVMEQIFNPFFTTKQPGEGTGMGLSIIHGIIKSYGGAITVDSELEKGTTFQVLFPCVKGDVEKTVEESTAVPTGSESILLVDDEEALAGAGQQILERLGYKVDARTSPVEALEAFRAQPEKYDLVITDKTMPNMTGEQLTRKLTEIRADIPIILCTGYNEVITHDQVRSIGIRECLKKPLMRQDIARTIREVLDNRKGE